MTISIFDKFSDGHCPQCLLDGRHTAMKANHEDFWECPGCRLQAHTASWGMMAVLRQRGEGKLLSSLATHHVPGFILTKDASATRPVRDPVSGKIDLVWFPVADAAGFNTEVELRIFLALEVE